MEDLFDYASRERRERAIAASIKARFVAFDESNPRVYRRLVALARQAVARGRTRIGIKMLWEVLRWEFFLETDTDDDFRLNNNYTAHYARKIMDTEPGLAGIFELRELRAR